MAYDKSFYEKYADYLKEETVRKSHDVAFEQFRRIASGIVSESLTILDLGCGLGEYCKYGEYGELFRSYVGVDKNDYSGGKFRLIIEDYHDLDKVKAECFDHYPRTAFVSLFSVECFHNAQEKYWFYERIFDVFPTIKFGLVSGFFYESKRSQETVGETGGIISYQTIEDPLLYISDVFIESRMYLKTPSKMFGDDVIEVWKFLVRR